MATVATAVPRVTEAFQLRQKVAKEQRDLPQPVFTSNNDEVNYQDKVGNFSKGYPTTTSGRWIWPPTRS